MDKHLIWATSLFLISLTICGTLIYLNHNAWTIRFEMDENTRDAIQSFNWSAISKIGQVDNSSDYYVYEGCEFDGCNYHCKNMDGIRTSTLRYCYNDSQSHGKVTK